MHAGGRQGPEDRPARRHARAAIGQAATLGGQGFELERESLQGTLTPEDFEDTEKFAGKTLKKMDKPIIITIDGKTVSKTVAKYQKDGLTEAAKVI